MVQCGLCNELCIWCFVVVSLFEFCHVVAIEPACNPYLVCPFTNGVEDKTRLGVSVEGFWKTIIIQHFYIGVFLPTIAAAKNFLV